MSTQRIPIVRLTLPRRRRDRRPRSNAVVRRDGWHRHRRRGEEWGGGATRTVSLFAKKDDDDDDDDYSVVQPLETNNTNDDVADDERRMDGARTSSSSSSVSPLSPDEEPDVVDPWKTNVGPSLLPSAVVANVGAFLFGYHTAVCNAPLTALANDLGFGDDDGLKGIVVSALVLGGACGGLGVGGLSDAYGRKAALTAVGAPLVLGSLASASATNAATMIAGRFITGIGVGASSQIVPLYLSEIAPPALRGTLNGFRRLAYVFGCLAAFQIATPLKEAGGEGWWRPLFSDAAVPAALLALGAFVVARESPVWLLTQGEESARESRRALASLQNIRGRAAKAWQNSVMKNFRGTTGGERETAASASDDDVRDEKETREVPPRERVSSPADNLTGWNGLWNEERNRLPLGIGLTLCALAAFSGSNTVIFYASTVFTKVGIDAPGLLTWAVGVPNVVGGFVALALSDKVGRRPLLLTSFGGMAVCLGLLSVSAYLTPSDEMLSFCADPMVSTVMNQPGLDDAVYSYQTLASAEICADFSDSTTITGPAQPEAAVALVTIPLYVLFFSLGAGPIPWLIYNEIFPTRIRARGVSMCTALNYLSNSIVGATFLPMVASWNLSGSYGLYTILCASGYVFVDRFVPETKGMKLENIESMLRENATTKGHTSSDS